LNVNFHNHIVLSPKVEEKRLFSHLCMRIFKLVLIVFCSLTVLVSCNKFSKIQKSKDYEFKLTKADEFFANKKYRFAQQLYEELFSVFKGTQKFEDLYYKYAYCFFNDGMYLEAENLFKGYLEVFPNSTHAEEVDYMRAYCFYKQSPKVELEQVNSLKAIGMMQTFINTHPGSERNKEATAIIDEMRLKLEQKELKGAKLYYDLGEFRASAIAYATLLNNFPESASGDEYKFMVVKSYYRYAKLSIITKQLERFEKVTEEYMDFMDRYPDSKLLSEAEVLSKQSQNQIKAIQNEQITSSPRQ
jgi:outer membrane protein assembly factor BamD